TLLLCLVIVILPLSVIAASLAREVAMVYQRIQSGQLDFPAYFQQVMDALPPWISGLLERFGVADLSELWGTVSASASKVSQVVAGQALLIGQNTFGFLVDFGLMLYLLFFLLRDGPILTGRIREAIPLSP